MPASRRAGCTDPAPGKVIPYLQRTAVRGGRLSAGLYDHVRWGSDAR